MSTEKKLPLDPQSITHKANKNVLNTWLVNATLHDVNASYNNKTLLVEAVNNGNLSAIKRLLKKNATIYPQCIEIASKKRFSSALKLFTQHIKKTSRKNGSLCCICLEPLARKKTYNLWALMSCCRAVLCKECFHHTKKKCVNCPHCRSTNYKNYIYM